ncbi:MAG: glycoside hydrolase family 25 protein [Bilifractor sp.]
MSMKSFSISCCLAGLAAVISVVPVSAICVYGEGYTLVGEDVTASSPASASPDLARTEEAAGTTHGGNADGETESIPVQNSPTDVSGVTQSISADRNSTASGSQEGTELMYFQDVYQHTYSMYRDLAALQSPYDVSRYSCTDQRMTYEDDSYVSRMGIDVSEYQGNIDWAQVKASGIDFAFIRIGTRGYESGSIYEDNLWEQNLKAAETAGLDTGLYFFSGAVNETEAAEEADYILNRLQGETLKLGIVLDAETIGSDTSRFDSLSREQYTANAAAFCQKVEEAGYRPVLYANIFWEASHYDMNQLSIYDIWYADYMTTPQTPYMYRYWQYTDSGTVPGISGTVDLDVELIPKSELVNYYGVFLLDALQQTRTGTAQAFRSTSQSDGDTSQKNGSDSCNYGRNLIRQ